MVATSTSTSLEQRLGYRFGDPELLRHALTHRSWCAEHPDEPSNERLEFLGDAVLGIVVTDHVFNRFPDLPEGQLAKTRATVVSSVTLADVGRELDLGSGLRLGKGEDASGGRDKSSILADAVEAVFGAVYLDGGLESARAVVLEHLTPRVEDAARRPGGTDYKTRLQELAARVGLQPPAYTITESGPDHHKRFRAEVVIGGKSGGFGDGSSKKEAEQHAARAAYEAHVVDDSAKDGMSNV